MDNLDFGRRAKERREMLRLSQKQVADSVGVSQPAIAKIEAGGSTTTTNGFALARALHTTLDWLEFGLETSPSTPANWAKLDEIGKIKVEAYIAGLLERTAPHSSSTQLIDEDRPLGG